MNIVSFNEIPTADLVVDAVYESSHDGGIGGEPLVKLLPGVGNQGGFRVAGNGLDKSVIVLFTTGEDKDWPDRLDTNTGQFVYFGDNKTPGKELHETSKGGNKILRRIFDLLHDEGNRRSLIPPIFVFGKCATEFGARSVQFKGLAVPGSRGLSATEDLVAVWKTTDGNRFQNYKAILTVLDTARCSRAWIADILSGNPNTENAPMVWKKWLIDGQYSPLISEPTTIFRSEEDQLPQAKLENSILRCVWDHFNHPEKQEKTRRAYIFEKFAATIFQMQDQQRVVIDEITRGVADGGRDAVGRYQLGFGSDPVFVDFSLEAKCYCPGSDTQEINRVGVKEVARLVSRLRHRQFGVLVTTSVVARQAYKEVREDRHPVIFITGKDITEILIDRGFNTVDRVKQFLESTFS